MIDIRDWRECKCGYKGEFIPLGKGFVKCPECKLEYLIGISGNLIEI